jgi:hypothetical protein
LGDSDTGQYPGQQKSCEQRAMHVRHILEFNWDSIVTKSAAVVISRGRRWSAGRPRPA